MNRLNRRVFTAEPTVCSSAISTRVLPLFGTLFPQDSKERTIISFATAPYPRVLSTP